MTEISSIGPDRALASRIFAAAGHGCPFCRAKFHTAPKVGEQVFFLSGLGIGTWGTVVESVKAPRPGEFHVQHSYDPNRTSICNDAYDYFLPIDHYDVPDWMPPLSMEDSLHFHESLISCILLPDPLADRAVISEAVIGVIACCWTRRLPVNSSDIWRLLEAHNVPEAYRDEICHAFNFGQTLATALNGRSSSRRRKMPAMSRIQYMTKGKEALWTRIKGHDNTPQILKAKDGQIYLRESVALSPAQIASP